MGEWSVILQKYMKKDNNLLFFFQIFLNGVPARGKQGKIYELKEKEN